MIRMLFGRRRGATPGRGLGLEIEAGQVMCPQRGVADVERCFTCGRFAGVDSTGRLLACGPAVGPDIELSAFGAFAQEEV